MVSLTPEMAGNTLVVMAIIYAVTIAYSVYIAILNRRQAKMYGLLEKTNELLGKILEALEKR